MKKVFLILIAFMATNSLLAQDFKFGDISKTALAEKTYKLDTTADAVFLFKQKKVRFEYDGDRGWTVVTDVHERIKIYNSDGFDYATEQIRLYEQGGTDEKVQGLKAYTYKMKGGKVEKIKLAKDQIFDEQATENWKLRKFTMPGLSDGCIVEWKYSIISPFYTYIDEIVLQHNVPISKLDISIKIPEYFVFKKHIKGFLPADLVESRKGRTIQYSYRSSTMGSAITSKESGSVNLSENVMTISKVEIPKLTIEKFVDNVDNYRSTLVLELSYTKFPNSKMRMYATSWDDVAKKIYESPRFGLELNKRSYFKDDLALLMPKISKDPKGVAMIYDFVKSKMKWNKMYGKYTDVGVRKAFKEGVGNVAEINLLLVAMLKEAGFNSNPVLVSTKTNGVPLFPTSKGFNFVIAAVEFENGVMLMDATTTHSTPNMLPLKLLNFRGRIVRENGSSDWVELNINKPMIYSTTSTIAINSDGEIEGMKRRQYQNAAAMLYRNTKAAMSDEEIIQEIEEKSGNIEIGDFRISNKLNPYKPIVEMYKYTSDGQVEVVGNKFFFNALFEDIINENPFKSESRSYPINFGVTSSHKNVLSITIPDGYEVTSLPESIAIGLPNDMGIYKYSVSAQGNLIKVISVLNFDSIIIPAANYAELKEFYKMIVAKHLEKISISKIQS